MIEVNIYLDLYNEPNKKEKGIIDEIKIVTIIPAFEKTKVGEGILVYHVCIERGIMDILIDEESYEKLKNAIENKKEELDNIEQALRIIEKAKELGR